MKTIGLIGGMSWQSTVDYYRIINDYIQEQLGELYSAPILLSSINFHSLENLQRNNRWDEAAKLILKEAKRLEKAGANYLFICSNTGNESVERIRSLIGVPIVHIADVAGQEARRLGLKKLGLIGTIYTMEKNYIKGILEQNYELEVIVPNKNDRSVINKIIYEELCFGQIKPKSKKAYLAIIDKLKQEGAEGIVLGCTEIPLLIKQADLDLPVLDTTLLHATCAAKLTIAGFSSANKMVPLMHFISNT
ncbi:MAG: aspartate/glutamate racemase family protein [Patescibacteria group bacterium]|jgi:aspartate racemase